MLNQIQNQNLKKTLFIEHNIHTKFLIFNFESWNKENSTRNRNYHLKPWNQKLEEAVQLSDKLRSFNSKFYQEFDGVDIICQKLTQLAWGAFWKRIPLKVGVPFVTKRWVWEKK